jgi:hypothetical protein
VLGHVQGFVLNGGLVECPEMPKGKNQGKKQTCDYGMKKKPECYFGKWMIFKESVDKGLGNTEK